MNNIKNILLLCVILFLASSCGKRFAGLNWNFKDKKTLQVNELDFDYFSAKAKLYFKDNKYDVKAKATIRIKKDSLIWMNFAAVGISGGRCLISRDSVTLLNILKKEYYVFSYEDLSEKFNYQMDFDVIQSVILGNMPKKITADDKVTKSENFYDVVLPNDPYLLKCKVNTKTMKLESVDISQEESDNNAQINYDNFQLVNDHAFAYNAMVNLTYMVKDGPVNTVIKVDYSKAQIEDKVLKFPFNVPKKYVRLQ
jgi:hypothetical protein